MPTDRLTTIIEMLGAARAAQDLGQVGRAAQDVADKTTQMTRTIQVLPGLFARFNSQLLTSVGGVGIFVSGMIAARFAVRELAQFMGQAMRQADEYTQALTRAAVLFGNAGRPVSIAGLQGLARERAFQLGIPEARTLGLAGQMAERGFSPQRIGQLLPALQNIEAGTGGRTSAESAMEMFLRVLERPLQQGGRAGLGGSRGLMGLATRLGINIRFTGNIENDLNKLTEAINTKFGGVAEALAATASGVHLRYQLLVATSTARLGVIMETLMAPLLETLNRSLLGFIRTMDILTNPSPQGGSRIGQGLMDLLIGILPGVGLGAVGALQQERARQRALQAAGARSTYESQSLDALRHIDANTQRVASLVAQSVFGQISAFTRGAMTFRELNMAINIRSG